MSTLEIIGVAAIALWVLQSILFVATEIILLYLDDRYKLSAKIEKLLAGNKHKF